ncbi:MAG: hypothetical protein KDE19_08805 [Caldilineaceae bacterium]|nr:hypothetical protein [Caldilineaceae bacterium]
MLEQYTRLFSPQRKYWVLFISLVLLLVPLCFPTRVHAQTETPTWYEVNAAGEVQLHFYFFWSESCPHCRAAHPFVESLPTAYPWLQLHDAELTQYPEHVEQYVQLAAAVGQEAQYVPAFIYCGTMLTGYDSAESTGSQIRQNLEACYGQIKAYVQGQNATAIASADAARAAEVNAAAATAPRVAMIAADAPPTSVPASPPTVAAQASVTVPLLGALAVERLSLPVMTVVLAGLDGFNPCAFFVLMFLLSLMVHAGSRPRMLLIGGLFVLTSGLIYFLFMAAWLNLFLVIGALRWITALAGVIAILLALINIKDYFWFKTGVSLSIPDRAKPKLYQRARALLQTDRTAPLVIGTLVLAVAANSYELLCTTGFPLIYTRMLTLATLPTLGYYLYLALYNAIYMIPLLLIVAFFAIKFGARKLSEGEGRTLKLLSGLMMLLLGIVLVIAPDLLGQVRIALALLAAALLITAITVLINGRRHTPMQAR